MRATEFIIESEISDDLVAALNGKGYKELNDAGADQQAFLEPGTGLVLKIFGTREGSGTRPGELTRDQWIFTQYVDYCHAHPNNHFLPQFSDWERFRFNGEFYLMIRMERLFEFHNSYWGDFLENMVGEARFRNDKATKKDFLDKIIRRDQNNTANDDYSDDEGPYENAGVEILSHLGMEKFNVLWDTVFDLASIARNGGFRLDLHSGNFMLGSDGEIVISDPFWSGSF